MKKSEIFAIMLAKVADICEVSEGHILDGCRVQAVVDARILLVQYLRRIGLSSDDIALIVLRRVKGDPRYCPELGDIKRKAKNMDRLFSTYSQRCLESYAFCLMSRDVRDFCREKYREHYLQGMKELPR